MRVAADQLFGDLRERVRDLEVPAVRLDLREEHALEQEIADLAAQGVVVVAILPLTRVPSRAVAIAAGIFAGGVLGNLLSASADGLYVPNPLIIMHGMGGIAFNPADTFILAGNLALMATLIAVCFRYRAELEEWRAARRTALHERLRSRA